MAKKRPENTTLPALIGVKELAEVGGAAAH
jgi:hypothetical protein